MRLVFHVPGRPVPKARPMVTKNGYAYTPRKTMAFEQSVVLAYRRSKAAGEPFPEGVPLLMELTFTFEPPKSWSKTRREEVIRRGMCPTCRPDKAPRTAQNRIADKLYLNAKISKRRSK